MRNKTGELFFVFKSDPIEGGVNITALSDLDGYRCLQCLVIECSRIADTLPPSLLSSVGIYPLFCVFVHHTLSILLETQLTQATLQLLVLTITILIKHVIII